MIRSSNYNIKCVENKDGNDQMLGLVMLRMVVPTNG